MSYKKILSVLGVFIFNFNSSFAATSWPWELNLTGKYKVSQNCSVEKEVYKQNERAAATIGELINTTTNENSPFISLPMFYRNPDFPITLMQVEDHEFEIKSITKDHISIKYDYFGYGYPHYMEYQTETVYPLVVETKNNSNRLYINYTVAPVPGEFLPHKYGFVRFTKISSKLIRLEYEFTIPSRLYHSGLEYLDLDWTNGIYIVEKAYCYLDKIK